MITNHTLVIQHKKIHGELQFSDISEIIDARQAFHLFVTEMSHALNIIQALRQVTNQMDANHDEAIATEQLFSTVVQATADYYFKARSYAIHCARTPQPASDAEAEKCLAFELEAGPYVRELGDSMSLLQGYIWHPSSINQLPLNSGWDPRDWCIERLIKLIATYNKRLQGDIRSNNSGSERQVRTYWSELKGYMASH